MPGAAPPMQIRPEIPADIPAVHALTQAAFAPMAFSDGTEADALEGLRDAGDLTLSLVATEDAALVGHIAFSPVRIDGVPVPWFGLGPISVVPARQRQGIGTALVAAGCSALKEKGALGIVLIGNPQVYSPMGFVSDGALRYRDMETGIVQYRAFGNAIPCGELSFAPALEV